jgi:dihydroorotate dehydrogenase
LRARQDLVLIQERETEMFYGLYEGLVRPCLFQLNAETAHNVTMKMMHVMGQYSLLTGMIRQTVANRPRKVMGIEFPNPVGLAAGLDKDGVALDALGALGFGFVEIGTVTPKPQPGNPAPRLFRVIPAEGIINRMGFNNLGVDNLVGNVRASRYEGVLGINIGKNKTTPLEKAEDDYLYCLEKVYQCASYVTVNISSPNTPNLRTLQHGSALESLISALKKKQAELKNKFGRYVPLAVKLAPELDDAEIAEVCGIFKKYGVDGVIATNTTLDREIIRDMPHVTEAGGLSGKPLFKKSTEKLKKIREELKGEIPIIGAGGIDSPLAAREKMAAGADLIQIYTSFIYKGPKIIKDIVENI